MLNLATIIVNYCSAALIGDLLASMARRSETRGARWPGRVYIVENGSGDDSMATLQGTVDRLGLSDSVQLVDAGQNRGFGAGNNVGAAAALRAPPRPEIIWFLNPDTLVHDTDLEAALSWFERDKNVGVVGTGLLNAAGGRDLGGHRDPSPVGEFVRGAGAFRVLRPFSVSSPDLERPGSVEWVSGASLMMRADVFEAVGGFDERFFLYFEEIDLCRRTRTAGWGVVYEPRTAVVHLEGRTTGLRTAKSPPRYWYESRRRFFVKHYGVTGLAAADLAWGAGRLVGATRGKRPDTCRLKDLWRCDARVIFGLERVIVEGSA
jgi:N-acetylglucosaminyl-diphospho-decaprenol L-rhamnosyltransferase